jgi:hypothetical protein
MSNHFPNTSVEDFVEICEAVILMHGPSGRAYVLAAALCGDAGPSQPSSKSGTLAKGDVMAATLEQEMK